MYPDMSGIYSDRLIRPTPGTLFGVHTATFPPSMLRYYPFAKQWTKRIEPHLENETLNAILVHDFNKFTSGRWGTPFLAGQHPCDFDAGAWRSKRLGRPARYWAYVAADASHWLVNFAMYLASIAESDWAWRIVMSDRHSTVWDGHRELFDLIGAAQGIPPEKCWEMAATGGEVLEPGVFRTVNFAPPYQDNALAVAAS